MKYEASIRRGWSVLELLTVIAIVSLLLSLLLPAVQHAREASRQVTCSNNLRQLGVAVQLHEHYNGHLPTNGWGFQWIGFRDGGFGEFQPGGWIFNTLPYREGEQSYACARSYSQPVAGDRTAFLLEATDSTIICPSRRLAAPYPYTEPNFPLRNAIPVRKAAKTDYAINAGDFVIHGKPGPPSASMSDVNGYSWPNVSGFNGVSFVRTAVLLGQITDGTSNTILIGEKSLPGDVTTGASLGDDQACYIGDDADNRRWTSFPPIADASGFSDIERFGSRHPAGCQFVMCDGSIRCVAFNIGIAVFASLGNRRDGNVNEN